MNNHPNQSHCPRIHPSCKNLTTASSWARGLGLALIGLLALGGQNVLATPYTSTGSGGDWSSSSTWSPSGPPNASDSVTIASGAPVTVSSAQAITGLTINSGATLTINDGVTLTASGSVTQTGTIQSSATTLGGGTLKLNTSSSSGQTLNSAPSTYGVNIDVATTGSGYVQLSSANNITINSPFTFTIENGATAASANKSLVGTGNFNIKAGGTLVCANGTEISPSGTASGLMQLAGTRTFDPGANYIVKGYGGNAVTGTGFPATVNNLTVNMNNAFTATLSAAVTVNGTLSLGSVSASGGQLKSCSTYLTLGNGANIVVSNTAVAGSLDTAPKAFGTSVNVTYAGTTATTTGVELPTSSSVLNNLTINNSGGVTLGANAQVNGTLTMQSGALALGGKTLTYGSSATLAYAGGSAQTTTTSEFPATGVPNLTINNAAGVTLDAGKTINGTVTLTAGQLKNGSGSLTLGNSAAIVVNNSGTAGSLDAAPTFGTAVNVSYTGTSATSTSYELPASSSVLNNLTLNDAAGVTLGGNATVNGTLTLTTGQLKKGSYGLTLGNSAAIVVNNSGTAGSLDAAPTFGTAVNVSYTGTSATTTSYELPASSSVLNNLTLNDAAGVTLGGNATVNGTLTFTSGKLTTSGNTLELASGAAISGAGSSAYVVGSLTKSFSIGSGQSFNFPIGPSGAYTPCSLANLNVTGAGRLTASTTGSDHPNIATSGIDSTKDANRYWTLTPASLTVSTYDLTVTFIGGDLDGSAAPTTFIMQKWDGVSWNSAASSSATSTSTTGTGFSSFSDFAVGNALGAVTTDHYVVTAGSPQTAGGTFTVTVQAKDSSNNDITTDNSTVVTMTSNGSLQFDSDGNGTFGDNTKTLSSGTFTINCKDNKAETITITATDGNTKTGSATGIVINPGSFSHLQLLVPGETAAPGTGSGKTGSPSGQNAYYSFNITVNAVDAFWNLVNTVSDTVGITSTDGAATLPSPAALASGTQTVSITLNSAGNFTITATDTTDVTKTANTSPSIVAGYATKTWKGDGTANVWNVNATANWNNNTAVFQNYDAVLFDNTGSSSPAIDIQGSPAPSSVTNSASQNYTFGGGGSISGSGTLTKSGGGTLTINNANAYSGGTALSAGQLNLNNGGSSSANSAIGTGALTISGGSIDNTSAGDVTLLPNNTQNWNGDFTYAGSVHNLNLGSGAVALSSTNVTVSANTLTVGGTITAAKGLTKKGAGTLTLSGGSAGTPSTFGGAIVANAGVLNLSGYLNNSASFQANGGGILNLSGANSMSLGYFSVADGSAGTVNVTGGITTVTPAGGAAFIGKSGAAGAVNISGGSLVIPGGALYLAASYNGAADSAGTTGSLTLSGTGLFDTQTSSDAFRLGNGTVNTVSATVNLNGGTLATMRSIATGNSAVTSTFNFNGGTLLARGANSTLMSGLTTANVRNGGAKIDDGGFAITIGQALVHSTIGGDNATDGGLTKLGAGTLTLSGASSFNGGIYITAGTVTQSTSTSAMGTGTIYLGDTSGSANATLASMSGALSFANPIVVQAGSSGNTLLLKGPGGGGSGNLTGPVTVNNTLTLDGGNSSGSFLILNGNLSGSGNLIVNNTSPLGKVVLQGTSSGYGGSVVVNNGTLRFNGGSALNAANTVQVNSGGTNDVQSSVTIAGLNDNAGAGGIILDNNGNNTLTLGGSGSYSFNGVIANGSATLSLTKSGPGIQTLGGVNTYTGNTTISAGTLALSGSGFLASANIAVGGGATLNLSGLSSTFTLGSSQTLNNSTVGAVINGNINTSSGTVSLVYDGVNPSFSITNGGMTLSSSTTFMVNNTGSTLLPGSYKIIAKSTAGAAGFVAGFAPISVAVSGGPGAGTPSLAILNGELYLTVGGTSTLGYSGSSFTYNGSAQSPTINFTGSTGAKTTNYVGTGSTTYASVNAPTNVGTYNISNMVAADANYFGATNSQTFTISQASTFVGASSTNNPCGYRDSVAILATLPSDAIGSVVFASTNGAFSTNIVSGPSTTSLSITNLPRGTNVITVAYAGDGNYLGSTNTLDQIVTNHPPVAVDASYSRAKGLSLKIAIADLLTNVTDVDGDTISLQSVGTGLTNATIMTNDTYVYYLPTTGAGSNDNDVVSYTVSDGFGGTATANILINVHSAAGSAQISLPTNGVANITFFGIPNYTYVVQTTTNLSVPWWPISTNTAGTNGVWQFTDPNATNAQQYYRSAQP